MYQQDINKEFPCALFLPFEHIDVPPSDISFADGGFHVRSQVLPESWVGINPALTFKSGTTFRSESSSSRSSSCSSDYVPPGKRLTRMRRQLLQTSADTRANILPQVPPTLVDQFWAVHRTLHIETKESNRGNAIFRPFFTQCGDLKQCLLCGYSIRNPTQIIQHLEGIHFELFKYRCDTDGCSFSSTRMADLKRHIRDQHRPSARFKCEICKRSIKHEKNLRRHLRVQH